MPSDDSTVATQADFVPRVVGNTDRDRSVSSATSAHDGISQHPRPGVQQTRLNVLGELQDQDDQRDYVLTSSGAPPHSGFFQTY